MENCMYKSISNIIFSMHFYFSFNYILFCHLIVETCRYKNVSNIFSMHIYFLFTYIWFCHLIMETCMYKNISYISSTMFKTVI